MKKATQTTEQIIASVEQYQRNGSDGPNEKVMAKHRLKLIRQLRQEERKKLWAERVKASSQLHAPLYRPYQDKLQANGQRRSESDSKPTFQNVQHGDICVPAWVQERIYRRCVSICGTMPREGSPAADDVYQTAILMLISNERHERQNIGRVVSEAYRSEGGKIGKRKLSRKRRVSLKAIRETLHEECIAHVKERLKGEQKAIVHAVLERLTKLDVKDVTDDMIDGLRDAVQAELKRDTPPLKGEHAHPSSCVPSSHRPQFDAYDVVDDAMETDLEPYILGIMDGDSVTSVHNRLKRHRRSLPKVKAKLADALRRRIEYTSPIPMEREAIVYLDDERTEVHNFTFWGRLSRHLPTTGEVIDQQERTIRKGDAYYRSLIVYGSIPQVSPYSPYASMRYGCTIWIRSSQGDKRTPDRLSLVDTVCFDGNGI